MVFLVGVTGETGVPCRNLPGMVRVADHAFRLRMLSFFVLSPEFVVAGFAVGDRFCLLLFEMARAALHRHHGRGGIDLVAGDAIKGRPVARSMAKMAEDL